MEHSLHSLNLDKGERKMRQTVFRSVIRLTMMACVLAMAANVAESKTTLSHKINEKNLSEVQKETAQAMKDFTESRSNTHLDSHNDIDSCGSSLNCIAHVLLTEIQSAGGGGGSEGRVVYFYHSDTCAEKDLIRPVRLGISVQACESLGKRISTRVWGVRYGNRECADISDSNFGDACVQYASEI